MPPTLGVGGLLGFFTSVGVRWRDVGEVDENIAFEQHGRHCEADEMATEV